MRCFCLPAAVSSAGADTLFWASVLPDPNQPLAARSFALYLQGWQCDMWDVLAPVRAVRPVNGGPGYDKELVLDLRTLNFEIA